ncbi:Acetyltransferase involved in cellulose biosynthesis, CelD/BcsL family [Kaistia soli DSM 19436]|uniref:Acetyltransferase involved in cellulose biosynthesis, CelD/BcsL family n=1 Tax=Kaistia soli DSM 19436 TaxID=1122133 RepID=A0A1M5K9X0_9HYPH|nr:GNAT family N-acetyltransferase [Kaistia soli]SHG49390.1 Acetyltransferase involved in cellulose biosynthesis, CelD/BcsL family [Kaistia soli DSM 19436]
MNGATRERAAPNTDGTRPALEFNHLSISVHAEASEIEADWRALFEDAGTTVYQSFDWINCWLATAARALGIRPALVAMRFEGRLVMLMPLGVERIGPLRVARHLGGEHANIRMPLVATDWRLSAAEAATNRLLARVASAIGGVDLFDFDALPVDQPGTPLFLAAHPAARPARINVGTLALKADFAALLAEHRGAKKSKKHRWQKNALASVGGYRLRRAESQADAEAMFDAFLAEKAAWFRRKGIADSFAEAGIAPFFRALIARRWAGDGNTVIDIDAIEFDGAFHAILGSGTASGRQSGYFLAVTDDEWRRISPGELLIHDVVAAACARGTACLDLGRGEERYKASWLDQPERHVRLLRPVTMAGRAATLVLLGRDAIERSVRNDQRLWRLATRLRRLRADAQAPADDNRDS